MFEVLRKLSKKDEYNTPLQKLNEKDIQRQLYGHLKEDAEKELGLILRQTPKEIRKETRKETSIETKPAQQTRIKSPEPVNPSPVYSVPRPEKIQKPEIKLPKFKLPALKLPKIKLPSLKLPIIKLPAFKMPSFKLPTIKLPSFKLPTIKLPHFKLPSIKFPTIRLPKIRSPRLKAPESKLPALKLEPLLKSFKAVLPIATIALLSLILLFTLVRFISAFPKHINDNKNSVSEQQPDTALAKPYTIQVAVYNQMSYAKRIAYDLERKGYSTQVYEYSSQNGTTRYRIYVGGFETKDQAQETMAQLQNNGFKDCFFRRR